MIVLGIDELPMSLGTKVVDGTTVSPSSSPTLSSVSICNERRVFTQPRPVLKMGYGRRNAKDNHIDEKNLSQHYSAQITSPTNTFGVNSIVQRNESETYHAASADADTCARTIIERIEVANFMVYLKCGKFMPVA